MGRAEAAAYVGLSESTFARQVQQGSIPQPRQLAEKRVAWLRCELDVWLMARPVSEQLPPPNTGAPKPRPSRSKVAANDSAMRPIVQDGRKAA
jgi:predicted DNA-binding transcriptional regulator AlpA